MTNCSLKWLYHSTLLQAEQTIQLTPSHLPTVEGLSLPKPVHQLGRYQCKATKSMKNQSNMTPPKEYNYFPATDKK